MFTVLVFDSIMISFEGHISFSVGITFRCIPNQDDLKI